VHSEILREARLYTEDNSNEARITPIPVHADIAARVSTTRETVARVLSDLTKQNILKREKDALMVLGLERLENLIDEARQ
jgi:CRP/FNR family cyclic AMP-dependent transcriptional regulator